MKIHKNTARRKSTCLASREACSAKSFALSQGSQPCALLFPGCLGCSEPVPSTDDTRGCLSRVFCKFQCNAASEFHLRVPVMLRTCAFGGHGVVPWPAGPDRCPLSADLLLSPRASGMPSSLCLRLARSAQSSACARRSLSSQAGFANRGSSGTPLCGRSPPTVLHFNSWPSPGLTVIRVFFIALSSPFECHPGGSRGVALVLAVG